MSHDALEVSVLVDVALKSLALQSALISTVVDQLVFLLLYLPKIHGLILGSKSNTNILGSNHHTPKVPRCSQHEPKPEFLSVDDIPGYSTLDPFTSQDSTDSRPAEQPTLTTLQHLENATRNHWDQGHVGEDYESSDSGASMGMLSELCLDDEDGDLDMCQDDEETIGQPGISVWEQLGEEFEAEAAAVAGTLLSSWM
ncbi:hypothetical protein CVT25_012364 [Psilocybe cyanescens]|uniref:Uncharacterized protein n=1 Tax=Psilocybe cyanescens TaxID=93625 RepID=A0A409X7I4_PSICY|nr:hypothetical protein CVT25_012364 [Psilocybe cyanescens]